MKVQALFSLQFGNISHNLPAAVVVFDALMSGKGLNFLSKGGSF